MPTPHPLTDKSEWLNNIKRKTIAALSRSLALGISEPEHRPEMLTSALHRMDAPGPWCTTPTSRPTARSGPPEAPTCPAGFSDGEADMLTRVWHGQ